MEFHLSISTTVVITFYVLVSVFIFHILNKKTAKRGECSKPPQANGAWPVIGHLHLLGGSQLPHKVFGDMAEKHGPIFTVKLGVDEALIINNAEMAKEIFTTNDKAFASRPKSEAAKIMGYNSAIFAIAPYGDYWRQVRKIVMLEVLSPQRVDILGHIRVSEVRASLQDIYDGWLKNKDAEVSNMVTMEMKKWFGDLILNIVIRVISGKRYSPNDEEGYELQMVVRKFFELCGAFVVSDFIPYIGFLDVGGQIKDMKKTATDLDSILERWLKEHKTNSSSAQQHESNQDFMNVLINILQGASEKDFPGFDHDTVIKSTCLQLLVAGVDTSSVTLTWALSLLLNNPKALEFAQAEIDEHVGKERLVEESDLKNLVYLDAIIKETMRLYPAAPLSVSHESIEDCIVGGYNIPKGTHLMVNLWKIHHDPNIWSDPEEFRPERFLTADIDVKGNHFELLPFGSGRRMCPGISFSLQALRLALASLIQQYALKRPSMEPIDMSESFGMTNSKATRLEVLLAPRLSSSMYHSGS